MQLACRGNISCAGRSMLILLLNLCLQEPPKDSVLDHLHVGAQLRGRVEARDPVAYAPAAQTDKSDVLYLTRARAHLKIDLTPDLDGFAEAQDDRQFSHAGAAATNRDNLDVHQAYFEWRKIDGRPLSIKIGRQELAYGDQRLVSPLDWANPGRAWDAAKVRYADKSWWVEAFASQFTSGNNTLEDHVFCGIYASCAQVADHVFDIYALGRYLGAPIGSRDELGNVGAVREGTFGFRLKGKTDAIDYSAEGAYQTGQFVQTDIRSWGFAGTLGYSISDVRFGVEFTAASGDENPGDGRRQTFTPPYPFSHFYQGFADVFAWRNGNDFVLNVRWKACESATLQIDIHTFWLEERRDGWYNASGAVIRRDATGSADPFVGNEVDFHIRMSLSKSIKVWTGYSHFFAGPFVRDTGPAPDMDWFFLQVTLELN